MADVIVVLILVLLIGGALAYIIRAKRNGVKCIGCPAGGNCPSSRRLPVKKLEGRVTGRKTVTVSGMHCAHCAQSVTEAINKIEGASAKVSLEKGQAVVSCDREIDNGRIYAAVAGAGFQVVSIDE